MQELPISKKNNRPLTIADYSHFRFRKPIPSYGIESRSILHTKEVSPCPGDLVICPVEGTSPKAYIGKFVKRNSARVLLELPSGAIFLVLCDAVLVVTGID